jgi:hypothetical protein
VQKDLAGDACLAAFAFIPSKYFLMSFSSLSADRASQISTSAFISITRRTYKVLEQALAILIASCTAALLFAYPSVATSSFSNPGVGHICLAIEYLPVFRIECFVNRSGLSHTKPQRHKERLKIPGLN